MIAIASTADFHAAVAAAMRYRVGGPLIDGLMAELGMAGGSLNGMLAGSSGEAIQHDTSPSKSAAVPLNGSSMPLSNTGA